VAKDKPDNTSELSPTERLPRAGKLRFLAPPLVLLGLLTRGADAQPGCPAVNFQKAVALNLKPSASSQMILTRQGDGSYTANQLTSAAPYRSIQTTPNYGRQLNGCLPKLPALPPLSIPQIESPPGAPSQPVALAHLSSGGYLSIQPATNGSGFDAVLFDSNMNFESSTHYSINTAQFGLADLNGDGVPDLIVVTGGSLSTSINVLIGNGGASFQSPIQHVLPGTTAFGPRGVVDLPKSSTFYARGSHSDRTRLKAAGEQF
jgi:hypothetical protein